MSRKTIPATTQIICDICRNPSNEYRRQGFMTLSGGYYDYMRDLHSTERKFDLCDDCMTALDKFIVELEVKT
jgi:hypothetical protein